ncbi:MAG: M24 family metallopeptidase [Candidatus Hydrogenedentota bacterium]
MKKRLDTLRNHLEEAGLDGFFSLSPPANEYLTGFTGTTSAVVVTAQDALFLCDFRYTEQAGQQVHDYERREVAGVIEKRVGEALATLGVKRAAFDDTAHTVAQVRNVSDGFKGGAVPESSIVSRMRRVKSPGEIGRIRGAAALADGVLADVIDGLRTGVAERDVAARIEYEFKRRGAAGASFDTITLFGARSSLPHGMPGEHTLAPGDVVLIDCGCRKDGYCSDLTRTCAFATIPGAWFEEIYELTLTAQQIALEAIRPGLSCRELDAIARDLIAEAGYGGRFGHGLGHGVGIEIHEAPRLNKESDAVLEAGMVVTIEPGIYLPGQGGVRIEDLVVVTESGCELLSKSPKNLKVLQE